MGGGKTGRGNDYKGKRFWVKSREGTGSGDVNRDKVNPKDSSKHFNHVKKRSLQKKEDFDTVRGEELLPGGNYWLKRRP